MKVDLMCHMGDDLLVVNAARCSFDKESQWEYGDNGAIEFDRYLSDKDYKLINFLAREKHVLPFRHPQATFRIHAPLFVLRQLDKHQVGFSTSEVSRRYVDDDPSFYLPSEWRARPKEGIKQGSGNAVESSTEAQAAKAYHDLIYLAQSTYSWMIEQGIAPEQARMLLPQSMHTTQVKTGSLLGWVQMIKLRTDAHAQKEIQDLANMIAEHIERLFPVSYSALMEN